MPWTHEIKKHDVLFSTLDHISRGLEEDDRNKIDRSWEVSNAVVGNLITRGLKGVACHASCLSKLASSFATSNAIARDTDFLQLAISPSTH